MKIDAISIGYEPNIKAAGNVKIRKTSAAKPLNNRPVMITFKGGNEKELFHQISELSIFGLGSGGVGTVGNDLFWNIKDFDRVVENIPLYNQNVKYKTTTDANGKVTTVVPNDVEIRKIPKDLPEGHPLKAYEGSAYVTNMKIGPGTDIVGELGKPTNQNKIFILDELGSTTMDWGMEKDVSVGIYRAKKDERLTNFLRKNKGWTDEMIKKIDITFTYVDATASMAAPYADGSYSFATGEDEIRNVSANWQGKPYPKEAKATAELLPVLKEKMGGFDPKYIMCHDGQAMPLVHFIAQKNAAGEEYYKDKIVTAIGHNLCDGYKIGRAHV